MCRVVGFGSALLDQLAHVPEAFVADLPGSKGGMELIDDVQCQRLLNMLPAQPEQSPGGSAANTIVALASLGVASRLLAKVGADDAGDVYRKHASEAGVETSAFKLSPDQPTGTCISLVTPDSERTLRTLLGAAATLSPGEITAADLSDCTHLHAEGYMLFNRQLMQHVLELARQQGCHVCIDLASPEVVRASADCLPDMLSRYANTVYANESEAQAFSGSNDPAEGLRCLSTYSDVAVVKLGREGALIRAGHEAVHVPAERVEAVDTTGAGDLWAAGFLYGRLAGCSLDTAGRMGAAVAAEVVCTMGAAIRRSAWPALRERLEAMRAASTT